MTGRRGENGGNPKKNKIIFLNVSMPPVALSSILLYAVTHHAIKF